MLHDCHDDKLRTTDMLGAPLQLRQLSVLATVCMIVSACGSRQHPTPSTPTPYASDMPLFLANWSFHHSWGVEAGAVCMQEQHAPCTAGECLAQWLTADRQTVQVVQPHVCITVFERAQDVVLVHRRRPVARKRGPWLPPVFDCTMGYPGEGPSPFPFPASWMHHPSQPNNLLSYMSKLVSPASDFLAGLSSVDHMKRGRDAGAAASAAGSYQSAALREPETKKQVRRSNSDIKDALLTDDAIRAALDGQDCTGAKHTRCANPLPNGQPCFSNLWFDNSTNATAKEMLEQHRNRFLALSQEARSSEVMANLKFQYYADTDSSGMSVGSPYWHYMVRGRRVCKQVYLLHYPVHSRTLDSIQERIKAGFSTPHAKSEEGTSTHTESGERGQKYYTTVGWYLNYADEVGDYMPDEQEIIVPFRDWSNVLDELKAAVGNDDAPTYTYFCEIIRTAWEVQHIFRARALQNFSKCTDCENHNANVTKAVKSRDPERIRKAKGERAEHHKKQRGERTVYYKKREHARGFPSSYVSIILDKVHHPRPLIECTRTRLHECACVWSAQWDSNKTTVPWFKRAPGSWWTDLKHNVLCQKVLGILVHGRPNQNFFFVANDTIKGDANLNIEGIRRTLSIVYKEQPLPRTVYVQADNASDNKCFTMLLFLGALVHHGYCAEVFLSYRPCSLAACLLPLLPLAACLPAR